MTWIVRSFVFLSVALIATACPAVITNFSYTQATTSTGLGTIAPFVYDDGGGPISFTATAMPSAVVHNPVPGSTPATFVGAQTVQGGNSNEGNTVVGLTWAGSAVATGTRGANVYTMQIPLRFVTEVNQTPTDTNDYTWNVVYGDSPANGIDTVAPATGPRFAMWFSRDPVVDATETPDTFQRYTQQNNAFTAGPNTYVNTDLTNAAAIKDATDGGAPAGIDAAGENLAFYFGWRDQNAPTAGAILIDDFTVGGLLDADVNTLRLVPEPSTFVLGAFAAVGLGYCGWRRRRK